MKVMSLQALLDAEPPILEHAEFDGPWDLCSTRNSLLQVQSLLRTLGGAHIRRLTESLKKRFPFSYERAYTEPGAPRTEALAQYFSRPADLSPTPFLPVLLFTLTVDGVVADLSVDELSMLAGYGLAAISQLCPEERLSTGAASLLGDICRVLRDAGQFQLAECIAEQAVAKGRNVCTPAGPLSDLFDALYDARSDRFNHEAPVGDHERLAMAQKMLAFIDDELAPATRSFNELLKNRAAHNPHNMNTDAMQTAIAERELALQHRRLTWEATHAMASRGWPNDSTKKWLDLARSYASVRSAANEAIALSGALDALIFLIDARAPYADDLKLVLNAFSTTLVSSPWRSESNRRDLLRRAVLAELALGRQPDEALLEAMLESLQTELDAAKDPQRQFILSTADDTLGVFLRTFGPDDNRFKSLYKLLRLTPLPPLLNADKIAVLRLFVTRLASAIHTRTENGTTLWTGEGAHDLARTLSGIARRAQRDINECLTKKEVPDSAPEWADLLTRIEGQTGLKHFSRAKQSSLKQVVVELDGLGVHIPIAGPLLDVWNGVEAIALTRLGFQRKVASLPLTSGVQILSGFMRDELWDRTLQRLANRLGVAIARFSSPESLQEYLSAAKSLVVIGAHGSQNGIAGALDIQIGRTLVPIEAAIADVRLPVGATVLCATCFAGSGLGLGVHGWRSMPECLLGAGARAVVANRWPAWSETTTETDFFDFAAQLLEDSVAPSAWAVPTRTTRFMKLLRRKHNDPRQWAGWGAWIAACDLMDE